MSDHIEQEITFTAASAWLGFAAYIVLVIIVALAFL